MTKGSDHVPKVLIGGAGGAPSEGVILSLLRAGVEVVGIGSEPTDLAASAATRKYWVPYAGTDEYAPRLLAILEAEQPDLAHFQNDLEVFHASILRDKIMATGTALFMPTHDVIDTCVHKYKTWEKFRAAGVRVPENLRIGDRSDLAHAFELLGNEQGKIWLRSSTIGAAGKGALPTSSFELASAWIDHHQGWGDFVAAQILTPRTVTWLSIWHEGRLIVAQGRSRRGWTHASRTLSGVTGVTSVGVTCSDSDVRDVALSAILAVDARPHGIYGVDMAYDVDGVPNPTEINISRFFTTILFFTEAGLNMPQVFADLGMGRSPDEIETHISPLPDGLMWLRGMDRPPMLCTYDAIQRQIDFGTTP